MYPPPLAPLVPVLETPGLGNVLLRLVCWRRQSFNGEHGRVREVATRHGSPSFPVLARDLRYCVPDPVQPLKTALHAPALSNPQR